MQMAQTVGQTGAVFLVARCRQYQINDKRQYEIRTVLDVDASSLWLSKLSRDTSSTTALRSLSSRNVSETSLRIFFATVGCVSSGS